MKMPPLEKWGGVIYTVGIYLKGRYPYDKIQRFTRERRALEKP